MRNNSNGNNNSNNTTNSKEPNRLSSFLRHLYADQIMTVLQSSIQ